MFNNLISARRVVDIDSKYRCEAINVAAPCTKAGSAWAFMRHALMVMGLSAMFTLGVMFVKPAIADQLLAFSPFVDKPNAEQKAELAQLTALVQPPEVMAVAQEGAEEALADAKALGNARQQKYVTDWIAKRYRLANDAANMLVSAAYTTALETKLDPLLILSVIAIESRFNPFAESPMGAQGLMQVMSKVHKKKFDDHGGVKAALNPVANIKVGSQILKEYVKRGGSVEAGLKSYVGAALHSNDGGYGAKVLSEYRKLKEVANGKRVSVSPAKLTKRTQPSVVEEPEADLSAKAPAKQGDELASADDEKVEKKL